MFKYMNTMTSPEQLDTPTLVELAAEEAASFKLPQDWMDTRMHREVYAVDGASTRDRDDAFMLSSNGEGHVLHVSIADTGSFVSSSMPAVTELASRRLGTKYRGSRALTPMMPRTLSERVFSLSPNRHRPALTAHIPIDHEGTVFEPVITREAVMPHVLTYRGLQRAIEDGSHEGQFTRLAEVSKQLFERRHPDKVGHFLEDEEGQELSSAEDHLGKFVVQECMILMNTVIADYMHTRNIPGLYRGHTQAGRYVRYSLEPTAHRGLNLSKYTHATSPLRRFGDFVNLSNIADHMDKAPAYTYDRKTLATIANRLNGVGESSQQPVFFVEDAPVMIRRGKNAELFAKLTDLTITPDELAYIFFAPVRRNALESRQELRQQALDYVINNPRVAQKIVPEAIHNEWVKRDIPLNSNGKPISGSYMLTTLTSEYILGVARKKGATPTALAIEVLGKAAGIEINPIELTQQFKVDARLEAALRDGDKYLRAMQHKTDIDYTVTATGEGSTSVVTVFALVDGKRRSRQGRGVNRKEALQSAATQLIQDLQLVEYEPAAPVKTRSRKK